MFSVAVTNCSVSPAGLLILSSSLVVFASASMTSSPGCYPTAYNSMPTRPSSFGSPHHAGRTNFLSTWSGSADMTSRRQPQLAISACTLILNWACADTSITARCCASLRQLRAIRRYTSPAVMQSLVTSLVLSRLDYCNSALFGLPASSIHHLQAVQNAAARLVFNIRRSEHVTVALVSLHWLRVAERIRFKVAVLAYGAISGLPPSYLHGFVRLSQAGRPGLRSASSDRVMVPRTRTLIGNRAFPVFGAEVWNNLPPRVTSAPNLSIFRTRLNTFLFSHSYPGLVV